MISVFFSKNVIDVTIPFAIPNENIVWKTSSVSIRKPSKVYIPNSSLIYTPNLASTYAYKTLADTTCETTQKPAGTDRENSHYQTDVFESYGNAGTAPFANRYAATANPSMAYTPKSISITTPNPLASPAPNPSLFVDVGTSQVSNPNSFQTNKYGSTAAKVLELLMSNPRLSVSDLSLILKIGKDSVKYHLSRLSANGLIKRLGSNQSGYWKVKKDD